jgi:hypothetical protein
VVSTQDKSPAFHVENKSPPFLVENRSPPFLVKIQLQYTSGKKSLDEYGGHGHLMAKCKEVRQKFGGSCLNLEPVSCRQAESRSAMEMMEKVSELEKKERLIVVTLFYKE